jgi:hypothetical protein
MTARRASVGIAALGLLLALWAIAPVTWLVVRATMDDGTFSGSTGPFVADQLQYQAWIRDASEHFLVSNQFDVAASRHIFLHPMFTPSGALVAAGASTQLALLVWLPVAAAALFLGTLRWARALLPTAGAQLAAAVLAIFHFAPATPIAVWLDDRPGAVTAGLKTIGGILYPAGNLWGYLPLALSLGLMPVYLLTLVRLLEDGRLDKRRVAVLAGSGLLISWLHPWQGVTLLLISAALTAWHRRPADLRALAIGAAGLLAPLAYYFLLAQVDDAWAIAREQTRADPFNWVAFALALAPLGAFAALGLAAPRSGRPPLERALRLWPLAALVVYLAVSSSRYHGLAGLTLPLAVLAVRGWQRVRPPRAATALALIVMTMPGLYYIVDWLHGSVTHGSQPHVYDRDQTAVLAALERLPRGPVLAEPSLAAAMPAFARKPTWAGHVTWSPQFGDRAWLVGRLAAGRLSPAQTTDLLVRSRARYVVQDCDWKDAGAALRPHTASTLRFGCVTLYVLG